ncbi:methyltransferase domain-containing protein [Prochlorococcus sp. MIT 0801]|uniref:methyltransferase domain-containing protein n=1 Tax=Prochlorococcus sp. MIT 0801 TaxID=1501269 RepID=UPI0004F777F8|nr:methyltransferase domain-containing protein [Prochlorococcus sp. MIT 0801]AIQ97823.1 TPR domain protein [Prochlorococcus sp. MIT 0801]
MVGFGRKKSKKIENNHSSKISNLKYLEQKALSLHKAGNTEDSKKLYILAINRNSVDPFIYSNLGNIYLSEGKIERAIYFYEKSIKLDKNRYEGYYNLAILYQQTNNLEKASISIQKAYELVNGNSVIAHALINIIGRTNGSGISIDKLNNLLNKILGEKEIDHNSLFIIINNINKEKVRRLLHQSDFSTDINHLISFMKDSVIINSLPKLIFKNAEWEKLLTRIRKEFCKTVSSESINNCKYPSSFLKALAQQCFLNEYIYCYTEDEEEMIDNLISSSKEKAINERVISLIACYYPLIKIINRIPSLLDYETEDNEFNNILNSQIKEPIKEYELSKKIEKFGDISDETSKIVQSQYESNPYPRWNYSVYDKKLEQTSYDLINNQIFPNRINYQKTKNTEILVAGCGTGYHLIQCQKYKGSNITGIDISLTSLSYAKRKLDELNISNIKLIQMDILNLHKLNKKYHIVECCGVLHHMEDLEKGLKSLIDITNEGGFIKLALYSELARKDIVKAKDIISSNNLSSNPEDIRYFRKMIFEDKFKEIKKLLQFQDFYSLSMCRDLCFHAMEHRFSISEIKNIINKFSLEFLGFSLPSELKAKYKEIYPNDRKMINLNNWEDFENKYPNIFISMYQFWVKRS